MKTFILLCGLLLFCCMCKAQAKPLDDGNYLIAQQALRDGNFLFAYKNYLIFEYLNFDRLNMPANKAAKQQLEMKIAKLEDYLNQNMGIIEIKRGRGWSDEKADSVLKSKQQELKGEIKRIDFN